MSYAVTNFDPCCCFCTLDSISATCMHGGGTCSPCNFLLNWSPTDVKGRASWSSGTALPTDDPIRWRCGSMVEFWAPGWISCGGQSYKIDALTVTVTCGEGEPEVYEGVQTVAVQLPESCGCEGCHIEVEAEYIQTTRPTACCEQFNFVFRLDKPAANIISNLTTCAPCADSEHADCLQSNWDMLPTVLASDPCSGGPTGGCVCCGFGNVVTQCDASGGGVIDVVGDSLACCGIRWSWAGAGNQVVVDDWFVFGQFSTRNDPATCRADAGGIDSMWGHHASPVNIGIANTAQQVCDRLKAFMVGKSMTTKCTPATFPSCENPNCNVEVTATVVSAT